MSLEEILSAYDYRLPKARIAQEPMTPRDASKLMILDRTTGKTATDVFRNIGEYLPNNAVLVLNETKVIPARLHAKRPTGGKVDVLVLGEKGKTIRALLSRRVPIGETLTVTRGVALTVESVDGKEYVLRPSFPLTDLSKILDRHGDAPLPPYIKGCMLSRSDVRKRYQTVFAKTPGSIAAPTASLHFTPALLKSLEKKGIEIVRVTLHVHLGTFAPLTEEQIASGQLHREEFFIDKKSADAINQAKKSGRPIVAVGTTVVRTLESAAADGKVKRLCGDTTLFIRPGHRFAIVDHLLTNFHVPKSSLLMLVSAFAGRENVLCAYRRAVRERFRFFSFGDAMFIR